MSSRKCTPYIMKMKVKAVKEVYPNLQFYYSGENLTKIDSTDETEIDDNLINAKLETLLNETAIKLLREKRNELLTQTDWMVTFAYEKNIELDQEISNYRQALRNFPDTINNNFNITDNGDLIVDFPTIKN